MRDDYFFCRAGINIASILILCGIAGGQKQVYVLIAKIIKTAQAALCICGMKKETILRHVYISGSENYTIENRIQEISKIMC